MTSVSPLTLCKENLVGQGVAQQDARAARSRGGHGGAWRAFCYEHSRGQQFTRESLQTLAAQYRALSDDELEHYRSIGHLAQQANAAGVASFPPVSRTSKYLRGGASARLTQPAPDAAAESLTTEWNRAVAGMPVQAPEVRVPHKGLLYSWVRGAARVCRAPSRMRKANEKVVAREVGNVCKDLTEQALAGRGGLRDLPATSITGVPDRCPAALLSIDVQSAAEMAFAEESRSALAEAWRKRHVGVLSSSWEHAPRRGHQKVCLQRGVCCCRGIGRVLPRIKARLQEFIKQLCVNEAFAKSLHDGLVLLEWTGEVIAAPKKRRVSKAPDQGSAEPPQKLYTHIALQYERPWRPTFVLINRLPDQDAGDQYKAFTCRSDAFGALEMSTLWEWLSRLPLTKQWDVAIWHMSTRSVPCTLRNRFHASLHREEKVTVWWGLENEKNYRQRGAHQMLDDGPLQDPAPEPEIQNDVHVEEPEPQGAPAPAFRADASDQESSGGSVADEDVVAAVLEHLRAEAGPDSIPDAEAGSSSSSSSTTSSSNSDDDMAAERQEAVDEPDTNPARGPMVQSRAASSAAPRDGPLLKFTPSNEAFAGFIRWNAKDQSLCAHCTFHGAQRCRRTRTVAAGRRSGQGRPLGHLGAWLLAGPELTLQEHTTFRPDRDARVTARSQLHEDDALDALFQFERTPVGEEDSEPEQFA